jgi:hypothetical protein
MTERITKRHLEFELGRLNANTGNPATPYTWIESDGEPRRLVSNKGHYGLETWNGATRLTRDGSRDITPLMTKRELHAVLRGINTVLDECERRPAPGKGANSV